MTQLLNYENLANQSGQSVQSDVEVGGTDLLLSSNDITGIELTITWDSQVSWQGCECYVIDPDGNYHYIFNSGSLPFGSGTRTDTLQINSGSFPFSTDGTWEFYLSDQMFNTVTLDEVFVEVQVTSANMPATYSETIWWNGEAYQGGIDLTNNGRHLYPANLATMVADTGSGGVSAFDLTGGSSAIWTDTFTTAFVNNVTMSASVWVKTSTIDTTVRVVMSNHGNNKGQFYLYQRNGVVGFFVGQYAPTVATADRLEWRTTSSHVTSGQWHHLAINFDGSQAIADDRCEFFVDGTSVAHSLYDQIGNLVAIPSGSSVGTRARMSLGGIQTVTLGGTITGAVTNQLDGLADDGRAWSNYLLSSDDITWLASARGVAGGPASFKPYFAQTNNTLGFNS